MSIITSQIFSNLFKDNKRKGQEVFPELIKRLIIATVNNNAGIRFPSGDSIWTPGFDGIITNITNVSCYVPIGNSLWEMGTNIGYMRKINDDYQKRTQEGVSFDKSEYSFMLCTPYIWSGTGDKSLLNWESEKNNLSAWKNVKIIDGEIITDWLNKNVEVALWLLKEFEKNIDLEMDIFSSKYKNMSEITKPILNSEIMLCSNNDNADKFLESISLMNSGIFILRSPISFEHTLYFVIGSFNFRKDNSRNHRIIFVENPESLNYVEKYCVGKIIIVCFQTKISVLKNNLYVCISTEAIQTSNMELNHIFKKDYIKALESMGFDIMECDEIAEKTNRNISCLKRRYADNNLIKNPDWASDKNKNEIIPIALLSEINCNSQGDKEIVSLLSGMTFNDYIESLDKWVGMNDSPIFKIDNFYKINSKEEALKVLSLSYNSPKLDNLEEIARNIFNTADNHYNKPTKEWNIKNTTFKYSFNSLNGILSSFAILSNDIKSQKHYDCFIKDIIKIIENDKSKLHTFVNHFSLLSEISASSMIEYVEAAIDRQDNVFESLILNEYGIFTVWNNFLYVMWMLQSCVKREEYSVNALKAILKIYYKNYQHSAKEQFDKETIRLFAPVSSSYDVPINSSNKFQIALNESVNLNDDQLKLANKLFLGMRFNAIDIWSSTPNPQWKQFFKGDRTYNQEFLEIDEKATRWLLDNTKDLIGLIKDLIDAKLLYNTSDFIRNMFSSIQEKAKILSKSEKELLYVELLKKIEWFNKFDEKENKEMILTHIQTLHNMIVPIDIFEKYRYVFMSEQDTYILGLQENQDSDEYDSRKSQENRIKRIKEIIDELTQTYDIDIRNRIISIISDTNLAVLTAMCQTSIDKLSEMKLFLKYKKINAFIIYFNSMDFTDEIKTLINSINDKEILKTVCKSLPIRDEISDFFDGKEMEAFYWQKKEIWQDNISNKIFEKVLKYSPTSLLTWMWRYENNLNYNNGIQILQSIINYSKDKKLNLNEYITQDQGYALVKIINVLDNQFDTDELAIHEFELLGVYLSHDYIRNYPLGIKRFYWKYPKQFFLFLKSYLEDNKIASLPENSIIKKIVFEALFPVGRNCCLIPLEYIIERAEEFVDWVNSVMNLAKQEQPKILHDFERIIINIMALCPELNPQIWPPKHVADMLEKFKIFWDINYIDQIKEMYKKAGISDYEYKTAEKMIAKDFSITKINSRGVRTIGDGSFEIKESERYLSYAKQYEISHPITSLALENIAKEYIIDGESFKKAAIIGHDIQ